MTRFSSHTNTAIQLVLSYRGEQPFQHFIRQYFSTNKKHGSRDRKHISQLCYRYFRLGRCLDFLTVEEQMSIAEELGDSLQDLENSFVEKRSIESVNQDIHNGLHQQLCDLENRYSEYKGEDIFPFTFDLSQTIDRNSFTTSHLIQPLVFARSRPGKKQQVLDKLSTKDIPHVLMFGDCIAFLPSTPVQQHLTINNEVVIQDISSQRTAGFLPLKSLLGTKPSVWDCCAASGGKSIMVFDALEGISLTATDVRSSIIHNLEKRFAEAGITRYRSDVVDLTSQAVRSPGKFDLVIADLPCSGSGTWGRAPENLRFFREEEVLRYAALQKKILSNVASAVKIEGYLLYITCSVFAMENEEVVSEFLKRNEDFQVEKSGAIIGYEMRADTMYACLFKRVADKNRKVESSMA